MITGESQRNQRGCSAVRSMRMRKGAALVAGDASILDISASHHEADLVEVRFFRSHLPHNFPFKQDYNAVGNGKNFIQILGNEENGRTLVALADEDTAYIFGGAHIQTP